MALNPWLTLAGLLLAGLVTLLFLLLVQVRKSRQHGRTIDRLEQELQAARAELEASRAANREQQEFLDMLNSAEITTRLQQPRLLLTRDREPDMPEKYRYVTRMIARGISREEISRILEVSAVEVEQLVTLARIGRSGNVEEHREQVKKLATSVEE